MLPFQESQAAKVLARYHANGGDEHEPLIVFEMAQIRHALKLEKEVSENSTFFQLWSTPGNLKRLRIIIAIAIFSQWRSMFLPPIIYFVLITVTAGMAWFHTILISSWKGSVSRVPAPRQRSMVVYR
jgi:hypothetical protein